MRKKIVSCITTIIIMLNVLISPSKSIISYAHEKEKLAIPVTNSNIYENTQFYKEGPLGTIGGFHLVGFDTVKTNAHTNGNILAKNLEYVSNFGTNKLPIDEPNEVSYIENISNTPGAIIASGGSNNATLVTGKNIKIDVIDNGNYWSLNGSKLDKPSRVNNPENLWQDTEIKFIDIEEVKSESIAINQNIGTYDDFGVSTDFSDRNNPYIEIQNPEGVNVYNLDASTLDSNSFLEVRGFDKDKNATLIINVDLNGKSSYTLPGTKVKYTDGSEASNGEVSEWEKGNVIWNIVDSSKIDGLYEGSVKNSKFIVGMILAPKASVYLNANLNGTVVANDITVNAESHRNDFTGGTIDDPDITPDIETKSIKVSKEWVDNEDNQQTRPEQIEIQLYQDEKEYGEVVVLNEENKWSYEFTNLPTETDGIKHKYEVKEVNVANGYEPSYSEEENSIVITNKLKTVDAQIVKVDEDKKEVKLEGAVFKVYKDSNDNGVLDKEDLAIGEYTTNKDGVANIEKLSYGKYLYKEILAPEGYELDDKVREFTVSDESVSPIKLQVTNKKAEPEIASKSIKVSKEWVDNGDNHHTRPEQIEIQLYQDGKEYGDVVVLNEENKWSYEFTNLSTETDGVKHKYEIKEVNVANGYEPSYSEEGNSIVITNKLKTVDAQIVKVDEDNEEVKLEGAVFKVYKDSNDNGVLDKEDLAIGEYTTNKDGVANIEKLSYGKYFYKEILAPEGYELDDKVREFTVSDESVSPIKLQVTNKKAEPEIASKSIKVSKEWVDNGDNHHTRPEQIEIQLYQDGKEYGDVVVLNEENKWCYEFVNLSIETDGVKHKYEIKEVNVVNGYEPSYSEEGNSIVITNKLKTVDAQIVKVDEDNEEVKLEGAVFKVYKDSNDNGVLDKEDLVIGEYKTNKDGVASIEKLSYGKYFYKEILAPEGYELDDKVREFTVNDESVSPIKLQVTNKKVEPEIVLKSIKVNKEWVDHENNQNTRPMSIEIQLYQDEKEYGDVVVLNEENKWSYEFTNLPTETDGVKHKYEIKEVNIANGYEPSYSEEENSVVITNKLKTVDAQIVKVDEDKKEVKLEGAVFKVYKDSNNNGSLDEEDLVIGEYTTNKDGVANIEKLSYGKYFYQEIVAPEGYELDDNAYEFNINEECSSGLKFVVTNKAIEDIEEAIKPEEDKGSNESPKTGDDNKIFIYIITFIISLLGLWALRNKSEI